MEKSNQFTFSKKCENLKIKNSLEEKKTLKKFLSQLILNLIPDDKKKEYIINKNGINFYKCPECNIESKLPLHNSHVGLTRSNMMDYILREHENNPKSFSVYYNELLDMHKYIKIAVCCGKCNEKHEINNEEGKKIELERILERIKISNLSNEFLNEALSKGKVKIASPIEKVKVKEKKENTQDILSLKNTPDDLFNLILDAYIETTDKISFDQAKKYKKHYKEIYKYLEDNFYQKIKSKKIDNEEIIFSLENSLKILKERYPNEIDGKKRGHIDTYRYPRAILGCLIKYYEEKKTFYNL